MSKIDLPNLHWLISKHEGRYATNVWSASFGTSPSEGCTNVKTFNYRVYVDISCGTESEFRLIAESYIINPWSDGSNKSDMGHAEFEVTEAGITLASEWLSQISTKYGF